VHKFFSDVKKPADIAGFFMPVMWDVSGGAKRVESETGGEKSKDRSLRQLLQGYRFLPVGAAEGCDLLTSTNKKANA